MVIATLTAGMIGVGFSALGAAAGPSAAAKVVTLFAPTERPDSTMRELDLDSVELGLRFTPSVDGGLVGLRFFRAQGMKAAHPATLWTNSGGTMATGTFAAATTVGWQSMRFAAAVSLRAGTTYVVSYRTAEGYAAEGSYFGSTPITRGPLSSAAADPTRNGVYTYSTGPAFPTSSYQSTNYYIDVRFRPDATTPTTPPTSPPPPTTTPPTTTPPTTTAPTTTPRPTGFPDASNTGVPPGVSLRPSGPMTVSVDGTVLDGLNISGDVNVTADNVTIKNSRISNNGYWGIIQRPGFSGLTVVDSEIFGDGVRQMQYGIRNDGGALTVTRIDMHTISNGIQTDQATITDSYFHDPMYFPGDHTDMLMSTGGNGPLVIRHNTVINNLDQTGAVALFQDFGTISNATIDNNLLAGGGYTLYAGAGSHGPSSNVRITGNVFSRSVWPNGGRWGPVAYWDDDGEGNVWSGNVWEDTGRPVIP